MKPQRKGGLYRSRLGKRLDEDALRYLSSLRDDEEILMDDIEGTEAHVIMLAEQGIIPEQDAEKILRVLEELREKALKAELVLEGEFEDIHEFIESFVIKKLGIEVGGKLHTGRSRNDQVALDLRLSSRRYLIEIWRAAIELAEALLSKAREVGDAIILHYTHLQPAQIGYLAQYLLAHFFHLLRDIERIESCYHRVNVSPLGACAIAGSTLPLNRRRVAELLGFDGIVENSVDAVSSRDFALEALSAAAILMVNLSRIAEDLIIWSSSEFGYAELPDDLASPSSVMPHKKNPCILELLRAKAGKVIGLLTAALTMMKGIPTGYDRDLQEGKPVLWNALQETRDSTRILAKAIKAVEFKRDRMFDKAAETYAPAIELAESLIKYSGLSLREAHMLVGAFVKELHESGKLLKDADLGSLERLAESVLGKELKLPESVFKKIIEARGVADLRTTEGSSKYSEVQRQLELGQERLEEVRRRLEKAMKNLSNSRRKFEESLSKFLN